MDGRCRRTTTLTPEFTTAPPFAHISRRFPRFLLEMQAGFTYNQPSVEIQVVNAGTPGGFAALLTHAI